LSAAGWLERCALPAPLICTTAKERRRGCSGGVPAAKAVSIVTIAPEGRPGDYRMMIRLFAGAALVAMLSACATVGEEAGSTPSAAAPKATGYFAQASTLPFHAPDFTRIADADLQPAIEQGIAITWAEIAAIANDPAPATFDNTLVAMQRAGQMLDRARGVLDQLTAANTNDTLDAAQ